MMNPSTIFQFINKQQISNFHALLFEPLHYMMADKELDEIGHTGH